MPPTLLPERIRVALEADQLFSDYLFDLSPTEAIEFIESSQVARDEDVNRIVDFLKGINKLIPPVKGAGRSRQCHTFRVGRDTNRRVIYLKLMHLNFPAKYRFTSLLKVLEKYAKKVAAVYEVRSDDYGYQILFWWI